MLLAVFDLAVMDILQDGPNTTSSALDPQQYAQFSPAELNFQSVMSHQDVSLPPGHIQTPVPSMFPPDLDHNGSMPMDMQIPSADVSAMDVIPAPLPERVFGSGMLSDFPGQAGPSFQQEQPHQLLSSPSATTASTSVSHASSPAMNGMVPAYAIGSSSLATALDGSRSRSGSSASPGRLSHHSSDFGFSAAANMAAPPALDPAFVFQAVFEKQFSAPGTKESSPDEDDQQRKLLHNVLKQ